MRAPRTLTARLVVTAVLLVAVVSALIGAVSTVALRNQQLAQLDRDVQSSLNRAFGDGDRDNRGADDGGPPPGPGNQAPNTIFAVLEPAGSSTASGGLVFQRDSNTRRDLSSRALARLGDVPTDDDVHGVDLPGLGSYRVSTRALSNGAVVVSGLPTHPVDETVATLVGYEALLVLLGLGVAAGLGTVVVRRQLRPLNEVAATADRVSRLPLASGDIDLDERVPAHLTDERTEVGRVGSALNSLLVHVESSLEARHRSEQQVRQFVADASHELRTPLATIHGYAELSRRTPDDPVALSGALTKVETETDRMSALVEDLLLLARLDSGRPLERTEVDVTLLLLESVTDARVLSPAHHWKLELPDEPVTVTGDENRLHQVVRNLLGNARAHTPPGTTVTVAAAVVGDEVRVSVHDDGPGFPPALVEHAFERFTRGDSSRTRASGGAGLGLSLVAAISEAHRGRASVDSRPGDTTLTVSLPR
ncbi:two-component system, OmpR family, sensor kinase [Nocardioides scoriae]|uniref:histidine kinase n=1 Tax=Nocardioides scoriae TaxID=642780 RepID=A0A1H1MPF1_9ACTN|nr:ATP-binding protein [Nocardioides scoriae]SDR88480.1 two-component system, OmpR family, sensor kinase [Nocardioides scoriae]